MIDTVLVPKHELLSQEDAEAVLREYNATREKFPQIKNNDPAIAEMKPNEGDIIRITRKNLLGVESFYYRVVVR